MLSKSFRFRNLTVPNRLVRSATCEGMADEHGLVTEPHMPLYRHLSQGRVGLIVTGHAYVRRDGQASWGMLAVDRDECIPGLAKIAAAVRKGGDSKIVVQINHGGRQVPEALQSGDVVAPSALALKAFNNQPRALRTEEVGPLAEAYIQAAVRVRAAGFDGVQLHGAHGYLISQFLSPLANTRDDEFGGTLVNRARFLQQIVTGIRQQVGPSFFMMIKLGAFDLDANGQTIHESVQVAQWLENWGIDAIEVSGGIAANSTKRNIKAAEDEGYFIESAMAIKRAVSVPVISVGGYRSKVMIKKILKEEKADLVALCRPLIREPDLIKKFIAGESLKAACISCNQCLVGLGRREPVHCKFVD